MKFTIKLKGVRSGRDMFRITRRCVRYRKLLPLYFWQKEQRAKAKAWWRDNYLWAIDKAMWVFFLGFSICLFFLAYL